MSSDKAIRFSKQCANCIPMRIHSTYTIWKVCWSAWLQQMCLENFNIFTLCAAKHLSHVMINAMKINTLWKCCKNCYGFQVFTIMYERLEKFSWNGRHNSLRPSDSYVRQKNNHHWFGQWLVAWSVRSYYLNQCWCIVNWTLRNKLQWNRSRNLYTFIQENAFGNVVCELSTILYRLQCLKGLRGRGIRYILWVQSIHVVPLQSSFEMKTTFKDKNDNLQGISCNIICML